MDGGSADAIDAMAANSLTKFLTTHKKNDGFVINFNAHDTLA